MQEHIPQDLAEAAYVWIRVDRLKGPLAALYCGPFKVLSKHPKVFRIQKADGESQTIDRPNQTGCASNHGTIIRGDTASKIFYFCFRCLL